MTRGPQEGRSAAHNTPTMLSPCSGLIKSQLKLRLKSFAELSCHGSHVAPDLAAQKLSHRVRRGACRGRQLCLQA